MSATPAAKPPPCVIGKYCKEHQFVHGAEAEQLRASVEHFRDQLDNADFGDLDGIRGGLTALLDQVDARDSLAFVEVVPHDKWKLESKRGVRRRAPPKKRAKR